jgi:hypothetical protein
LMRKRRISIQSTARLAVSLHPFFAVALCPTLRLSGRLRACSVEEDSLRRPVHSRGWLDGLFAQESRSSSSSLVCSVSRRILESNPGPSVSPEWTGTTVVRPSGCRIK